MGGVPHRLRGRLRRACRGRAGDGGADATACRLRHHWVPRTFQAEQQLCLPAERRVQEGEGGGGPRGGRVVGATVASAAVYSVPASATPVATCGGASAAFATVLGPT